jgi:hypothetical protein
MKIKSFPYDNFALDDPEAALAGSLEALYMGRFLGLDSCALSLRGADGLLYVEGTSAAWMLLGQDETARRSVDAESRLRAVHDAIYAAYADIGAVVSGRPPHAMALLEHGLSLGSPTSMMRKRNVLKPDEHVYDAVSIRKDGLGRLLREARSRADAADMGHMLMIVRETGVICAAPNLPEAVAHYQNVELLARLEVARLTTKG